MTQADDARANVGVRFFPYDEDATDYLAAKDERLGDVITRIGHIDRRLDDSLFESVVHHIVGQQISTKAQATVWRRMQDAFSQVDAQHIAHATQDELQSCGMTFKKAAYIQDFARKVESGEFDIEAVEQMPDEEAILALTDLKGVGRWTAEMILTFCLARPDVLAFDDLAIQRGLRMVYHHRKITRALYEKYRRRYSPYGSVASLYLWEVSGGALPDLRDWAPKKR